MTSKVDRAVRIKGARCRPAEDETGNGAGRENKTKAGPFRCYRTIPEKREGKGGWESIYLAQK